VNSLRVLTCGILLSAGLAFLGGCGKKAPEQTAPATEAIPPPVPEDPSATRIGIILPLSGAQASFGNDAIKGAQLAESEINAAGGVLGHPIKLIVRDSQSDTEATLKAVNDLAEKENAVALIGEIASDRTLAAAPVAQKLGIPLITPGATHAGVTAAGDYIFRVCYTDAAQAVAMAKFARSIDVTKAAMLYDATNPYSSDLAAIFKKDFTEHGGQIVAETTYQTGESNFSTQLQQIKAAAPEIIFLPSYYREAAMAIIEARQLGIDVPFLGTDGWDSSEFLRVGGKAANNSYFASHFSAESRDPAVVDFVKRYSEKYQASPAPLAALGYDSVALVVDALKRAGTDDPEPLKNALAGTQDFPGVTGKITFDEKHNPSKPAFVLRVQDGKFSYIETVEPR